MLLIKDLMRIYLRNGKKLNTFSVCLALIFLSKIVANSRQLSINQFFNIILKKCLPLVALRQWTIGSKKYKIPVSISLIKGTHLVAK
jgi:ribosomal protein S7